MSTIYVCGLDEMPRHFERLRPERLISLLPADEQPPTPPGMRPAHHLRLTVVDVDDPRASPSAPARSHIEALIDFLRATPPRKSILIHCLAGVSRSPAAALVALALDAPGREQEAVRLLRRAAPFADPNRLMIEIADDLLARGGALTAARESMGPPDWERDFEMFAVPRGL